MDVGSGFGNPTPHESRGFSLGKPPSQTRSYDSDPIRAAIEVKGAVSVIPNNPSRARRYPFDKDLYAMRSLIECCFSKLKQFRRVATRYEKTATNFLAIVTIAAIVLWIR